MWFLLVVVCHTQLLLAQVQVKTWRQVTGDARLILQGGKDPCHGHVEIFYNSTWGFVGDQDWDNATEVVVCRSTQCGSPEKDATEDVLMPRGSKVWLNEVKCNGDENHLFDCDYPGKGLSFYQKETVKKIKCSHKVQISLDGFKCAGAVQFSVSGKTGYFCAKSWGQKEADSVCESLGCGKSEELDVHEWMMWKEFKTSDKMKVDCENIRDVNHLWQCVTWDAADCGHPASVLCTGFQRLQLRGNTQGVCSGQLEMEENGKWIPVQKNQASPDVWCRQMNCGSSVSYSRGDNGTQLTCTDTVSVVLMDRGQPSRCYGAVHVNMNGTTRSVCASWWTMTEAEVTCRELNCGSVITYEKKTLFSARQGIMDKVNCLGGESSLWHCRASRDRDMTCSTAAHVVCAGSLDVRLQDAPGRCAGRVDILYEGRWTQVSTDGWTDANTDTVCRHVHCGDRHRRHSSPKQHVSRGSADFLTHTLECSTNASSISECFTHKAKKPSLKDEEAVRVTCEEHKVLILKGDDTDSAPCSGSVGIVNGNDTYWLSGSTTTWNQESANAVCQQMHCGNVLNFSFSAAAADVQADVWEQSYNCSSNATSLFDCSTTTRSHDHNRTTATVKCSGTITMNLTEDCWGTVSLCLDGKCGGVCADSWTHTHSTMLCQSLGCGNVISPTNSPTAQKPVMVKSLHAMKNMTSLSHCVFVMNEEKHACQPAYVVCSGSLKPRFIISRDKCFGNLEVVSEGQRLPVCMNALQDEAAQHTICEELHCGRALAKIAYFGPTPAMKRVISNVQCPKTGTKLLSDCNISSTNTPCVPAGLRCSDWRKIKVSETCSGAVSVHSNGRRSAVAIEGWTETEGQRLCQDLQCGSFKSMKVYNTSQQLPFWNRSFSCENGPQNIWDCEKPATFSQKQQLLIECQGEPTVTLSEKCHGFVKINGKQVCNSNWKFEYSHLVCQEQKCSNAIVNTSAVSNRKTDYYHVRCDDFHYKLGQCMRVQGKCDAGLVFVNCMGSIKFGTAEKCGGQLLIHYRNVHPPLYPPAWEAICPLKLPMAFMEKLCHKLGCDGYNDSIVISPTSQQVNLETSLECTPDHKDIKYCVTQKSCKRVHPATIYCNGYEHKDSEKRLAGGNSLSLILGVGLCLAVLIVIIIFVWICFIRKSKNALKITERTFSRKEVQFESDDYEDVRKMNEMADLSRSRFTTEAEFVTENDAHSISSFAYDDITEAVEAQPLTTHHTEGSRSEADDVGSVSSVSYDDIAEAAEAQPLTTHHTEGEVTYGVDDSQESYDDIEAGPGITRTTADIHHSSTTGIGGAVAFPGSVQED